MSAGELIKEISIPVFTGVIGYVTNWTGIWMLFNPIRFKGIRIPGLKAINQLLPRKVQQIPGVMHGGIGWQGIIPSRAAKMGSIAVDKGIAKVGDSREFYEQIKPECISEHILDSSREDVHALVDETMEREHPQLWHDLPPQLRRVLHQRIDQQLPALVSDITNLIGEHIDQMLDVKMMVIRHIEARPALSNRMFREVGEKELRFIINFGFFFGFTLGIPVIFIMHALPYWWVLPILGTVIGYATNWLAIYMIFEPAEARTFLGRRWQGLFLKRQEHAAETYASIVADEIITIANIAEELLHGPRADRTRAAIENALRPAVDNAVGQLRPLVRVAVGTREYDAIRESVATGAVDHTMTPLMDPEFNRRQSRQVHSFIAKRMRDLPPAEFAEMLRSAMREDEWLLVLHGAVLGFGAGLLHLAIFGV